MIEPVQSFWKNGIYVNRGSMFSMDIEEFIERGRQGDEDALGSLYKAYHRQMTVICQRIVGNRQVAEELAHDAFLLAFAKIDQLRNPQRFEAWLTSITTNVARRYMQRHHDPTMLSLSTLSEDDFPMEPIPTDDKPLPTMAELLAAVDALPIGYGQVFRLAALVPFVGKDNAPAASALLYNIVGQGQAFNAFRKMVNDAVEHGGLEELTRRLFGKQGE
jgi:DNA-directed RNA polymerase specialized sigma24 family protein